MKTLKKIEKKKETWFLFLIIFIFFLFRLPSLIEPLWYGDEGIYEVVGMALNHNRLLYSQIWDNKPPLLYAVYAIAQADQFNVRFLSLIFGLLSVLPFYLLSKKLFRSHKINIITTIIYVLFFSTPILEGNIANAENFMLLLIIIAAYLMMRLSDIKSNTSKNFLFISGILLGLAFLFKIVAVFDFSAFFVYLLFILLPENFSKHDYKSFFRKIPYRLVYYFAGFLLPIGVTFFYFWSNRILADFINATFFGNVGYVGYANNFIIPNGFLILKVLLLISGVILLFIKRKILSPEVTFILLWFLFSLFNALFSGRIWTHYLLVLLPSAILMTGLFFDRKAKRLRFVLLCFIVVLFYISSFYFKVSFQGFTNIFRYYQNYLLFITDNKSLTEYQSYFDSRVPRDYEIAQFIGNKAKTEDNIFIWGNNPQIYVLAKKLPPGKYTVEYHIVQNKKAITQTEEDFKKSNPKYVIILPEMPPIPFSIEGFENKFNLNGAIVYERNL